MTSSIKLEAEGTIGYIVSPIIMAFDNSRKGLYQGLLFKTGEVIIFDSSRVHIPGVSGKLRRWSLKSAYGYCGAHSSMSPQDRAWFAQVTERMAQNTVLTIRRDDIVEVVLKRPTERKPGYLGFRTRYGEQKIVLWHIPPKNGVLEMLNAFCLEFCPEIFHEELYKASKWLEVTFLVVYKASKWLDVIPLVAIGLFSALLGLLDGDVFLSGFGVLFLAGAFAIILWRYLRKRESDERLRQAQELSRRIGGMGGT